MSAHDRDDEYYALLARAWRISGGPLARDGELTEYRVDFGTPLARLPWDNDTPASVIDLLTWNLGGGRELLLTPYPLRSGAPHGPAFTPAAWLLHRSPKSTSTTTIKRSMELPAWRCTTSCR